MARVQVDADLNLSTRRADKKIQESAQKAQQAFSALNQAGSGLNVSGAEQTFRKLSQPLGRITGQANEFEKSLEASNARVLAFGASVVVINKLNQAFSALVKNTIQVEKTFAEINVILGGTQKKLEEFGQGIFDVARNTGNAFETVAEGALELARQGLGVEETLSRVSTALKLVRVSGVDSQEAVAGLTAAIKGFSNEGLNVAEIADKLAEVDTKFAVSTQDLINGIERSAASARAAGVSFDQLLGLVTTLQERTQRGGNVIGNAFKTIFARVQSTRTLDTFRSLGIEVEKSNGEIRDAVPLFEDLADKLNTIGLQTEEAQDIIQKVAGVRQRDILINLIEDLNSSQSQFARVLLTSADAIGALDRKNEQLNKTFDSLINNIVQTSREFSALVGELGFGDAARAILQNIGGALEKITDMLQGESMGSDFAKAFVAGVGNVLTTAGIPIITAVFIKLFYDLSKFAVTSLRDILNLNSAAKQQEAIQKSIFTALAQNEGLQQKIFQLGDDRLAQEQLLLKIYTQQSQAVSKLQKTAAALAPGLSISGVRIDPKTGSPVVTSKRNKGTAAGGYIAQERRDISRGVGGASPNSSVVTIPNFAFGKGQRGTMIANSSEYYVPNFQGGADAIFNPEMAASMGLPKNAKKLGASKGYVPNFAKTFAQLMEMARKRARGLDASRSSSLRTGTISKEQSDEIIKTAEQSRITGAAPSVAARKKSQQTRKKDIESALFDIDAKGATMLVPQSFAIPGKIYKKFSTANREKYGGYSGVTGLYYGINPNLKQDKKYSQLIGMDKELDDAIYTAARNALVKLSPSINTGSVTREKIDKDFRQQGGEGAFKAFKGSIFEAIISNIVGASRRDKKNTLDVKFDNAEQRQMLERIFNLPANKYRMADYKSGASEDNIDSFAKQVLKNLLPVTGARQIKKSAEGYIPNFAMSPLEDAIAREKAAGLPINQIRVNQDSKLRNSSNPMGLAVTNTRDEPTGRIPNFAQKFSELSMDELQRRLSVEESRGRSEGAIAKGLRKAINAETEARKQATKALRGSESTTKSFTNNMENNIGKLFLLQSASLMLSGAMGSLTEESEGLELYLGRSINQLQSFASTLITLQLLGVKTSIGFGKVQDSMGKFNNRLSKSFSIGRLVAKSDPTQKIGNQPFSKLSDQQLAAKMARERAAGRRGGAQDKGSVLELQRRIGGKISPLALGLGRLVGSIGKLIPLIGPLILGFQALNSLFKIFSGQGIFGTITSALGDNTKSLRESKEAIIAEYKARMENVDSINNALDYQRRRNKLDKAESRREQLLSEQESFVQIEKFLENLEGKQLKNLFQSYEEGEGAFPAQIENIFSKSEMGEVPKGFIDNIREIIGERIESVESANNPLFGEKPKTERQLVSERIELIKTELKELNELTERLKEGLEEAGGRASKIKVPKDTIEVISDIRRTLQKGFFREEDLRLSREFALQIKAAKTESESLQTFYERQLSLQRNINEAEEKRNEALFESKSSVLKILEDQTVIDEEAAAAIKERFLLTNDINELYQSLVENSEKIFESDTEIKTQIKEIIAAREEEQQQIERSLELAEQRSSIEIKIGIEESKKKLEELNREIANLQGESLDIGVSNFRSLANEIRVSSNAIEDLEEKSRNLAAQIREIDPEQFKFYNKENFGSESLLPDVYEFVRSSRTLNFQGFNIDLYKNQLKEIEQLTDEERAREKLAKQRLLNTEESLEKQLLELNLKKEGLSDEEISLRLNEGRTEAIREQIQSIIQMKGLDEESKQIYSSILSLLIKIREVRQETLGNEKNLPKELAKIERQRLETSIRFERSSAIRDLQRASASRSRALTPQEEFEFERRNLIAGEQERISDLRFQLREARARAEVDKSDSATERVKNLQEEIRAAEEIYKIRLKTFDVENKPRTGLEEYVRETEERLARISNELPRTMAENLESSLADAFTNIATGAYDSIGTAFLNIALDFGRALQEEITRAAAANIVSGVTNSAIGQRTFQGLGNAIGNAFSPSGGTTSTTATGTDQFYAQAGPFGGFATGGYVSGGSGVKDDVPARLTGGEYVVRKSAVQKYGVGFLENLNNRNIQKYQEGGFMVPGQRGQGAISGMENLLNFSKQSITSGSTDLIKRRRSGISSFLEPQSMRLSFRGRFITPSGQKRELKSAQQSAFDVRARQIQEDLRVEEQNRIGLQRVREANEAAYQRYLDRYMAEYNRALRQYNAEWDAREKQLQQGIFGSILNAGFSAIGAGFSGGGGGQPTAVGNFPSNPTTPGQPMQFNRGAGGVPTGGFDIQTQSGVPVGAIAANGGMMSKTNALLMGGEYVVSPETVGRVGKSYLDDINNMRAPTMMANGGAISNMNSLLTDGEYVMSPETVGRVGKSYLDDINNMRAPTMMANGGAYGSATGEMTSERKADVGAINININVEKNGDTSSDEDTEEDDDPQKAKEFSKRVRQVVLKVIQEEKRVSGSLFTRNNKK